jgi:hypothetical protein
MMCSKHWIHGGLRNQFIGEQSSQFFRRSHIADLIDRKLEIEFFLKGQDELNVRQAVPRREIAACQFVDFQIWPVKYITKYGFQLVHYRSSSSILR